jgi:anti-sigma-K factor RskA
MNYRDPKLRDMLASEYALGTLHGPARRRFERLMAQDAHLRRNVAEWQERLAPMTEAVVPIPPPKRVWRKIESRIRREEEKPGFWGSLNFWRGFGMFAATAAAALLIYIAVAPKVEPVIYAAVLSDQSKTPFLEVRYSPRTRELAVNVLNPQSLAADRSFELWSLPKGGAPQSLGLVPDSGKAVIKVTAERAQGLPEAPALAISLEPKGGSTTGTPTGPVLFTGPLVKI